MTRDEALALIGEFLRPLPADQFFAEILGRRVAAVDGDAGHPRAALLGPDPRATVLAAYATHASSFGFHADGVTGPPPPRDGIDSPEAFAELVAAHHERGYTLHIPDMATLSQPLRRLVTALETMLHQPVQASLFWSRPGNRAPVHYDDRDNLTVQLVGAKRWYVATEPSTLHNPWRGVAEAPAPLGSHRTLDRLPGELLFIPRGTRHTVETRAESLHLSIAITPTTVRETIAAALDHLSDYEFALRDNAFSRVDRRDDAADQIAAKVIAGLELLLARSHEPGFLMAALDRRASRFVSDLPKLPRVPPLADLSPASEVRHSDAATSVLLVGEDMVDFALPGQHLNVHKAAEPALRFIAATSRFRVADLPGLSDELRVALVARLIASGYLIPV